MAAADLRALRDALRDLFVSGLGDLNGYAFDADQVTSPAVVIGDPEPFDITSLTFGRGMLELFIPVTLVSSAVIPDEASKQVDGWVLSSSALWPVVIADRTLGGLVDDCVPTTVTIGKRQVGEAERQAVEVRMRVLVRRDA